MARCLWRLAVGGAGMLACILAACGPSVSSVTPRTGSTGAHVVIAGSGFGASQGTSQVLFAGASVGPAVAWSETSLTVAVPAGANTGPLVVEVGGSSSSPTGFIVTPPPLPSVRIGTDVPAALSEYPAAKAYEPPREIRRPDCLSQATMA